MKTEIILIRHGETEANRLNIFRGQLDVNLNENGLRQAEEVGEALKNRKIDLLYSSPLKRAMDTARSIAKKLNLEVNTEEGFNNINLGEWQGKPKEEIKTNFSSLWHQWVYDTENIKIPGGESLGDIKARTFKTLQKLIEKNEGKCIAIVSHRCALKVLLAAVLDIEGKYFWKIYLDNASYSIVEYDSVKGFTLTLLNEACHLSKKVYEEF
jgi:phosphoserine phosphatase